MRLLLVEDDEMIGEAACDLLRSEDYAVDWVRDGSHADNVLRAERFDLVVLDLGLPGMDGLDVLRRLRARRSTVPVLVATARDAVAQRVAGLDAGADDYVVKPFVPDELLARIRALLRRAAGRAGPAYRHGGVEVDLLSRKVTKDGVAVILSAREWAVLEALVSRPAAVLSRAQLEEKLYGWKDGVASNAVEVHVHGLRRKLGADLLRNVRGVGYWVPDDEGDPSSP